MHKQLPPEKIVINKLINLLIHIVTKVNWWGGAEALFTPCIKNGNVIGVGRFVPDRIQTDRDVLA